MILYDSLFVARLFYILSTNSLSRKRIVMDLKVPRKMIMCFRSIIFGIYFICRKWSHSCTCCRFTQLWKKELSAICRLLADGYAIRTYFYVGKKFDFLKPSKIYKFPERGRIRHPIVLIGAGRRGSTNYYYHFINSWYKIFCLQISRRGVKVGRVRFCSSHRDRNAENARDEFGMIREFDIRVRPVTFLRHENASA